jgi:hypothetical protein
VLARITERAIPEIAVRIGKAPTPARSARREDP